MATRKTTKPTVETEDVESVIADTTETSKTMAEQVSVLAEKAVIVPIGASLIVRDDLRSAMRRLQKKYTTSAGLEKELTRYEKRGARARNRFEKQVRSQRKKFERELKARRKDLEKQSGVVSSRVEEFVAAAHGLIS
jgi:16S rRNA G1207 methylase RsmC